MTGLAEAVKSRTPLLLVAGDTPTGAPGGNLDIDQEAVATALGAGVQRLRGAKTAVADIVRAVRRALVERRPVVLSLPIDLQNQGCPGEDPLSLLGPPLPPVRPSREAIARVQPTKDTSGRRVVESLPQGVAARVRRLRVCEWRGGRLCLASVLRRATAVRDRGGGPHESRNWAADDDAGRRR